MTNREVAANLFVTPKTVESALTRIYRKLGVRSRTESRPPRRGAALTKVWGFPGFEPEAPQAHRRRMPRFLVESYVADSTAAFDDARERARLDGGRRRRRPLRGVDVRPGRARARKICAAPVPRRAVGRGAGGGGSAGGAAVRANRRGDQRREFEMRSRTEQVLVRFGGRALPPARPSSSPSPAWSAQPRRGRPGRRSRRSAAGGRSVRRTASSGPTRTASRSDKAGQRLRRGHGQLPHPGLLVDRGLQAQATRSPTGESVQRRRQPIPTAPCLGHGPPGRRGAEASAARRQHPQAVAQGGALANRRRRRAKRLRRVQHQQRAPGDPLRQGGRAREGKTFGGFSAPGDVETSPDGSVYVVDGLNGQAARRRPGRRRRSRAACRAVRSASPSTSTATCG